MKLKRWTTLLQNQVVAIVLMLLFVVPLLFGATNAQRTSQLAAYGFLGLVLLVVWLLRVQDRLSLAKARAFVQSGPNLPILLFLAWGLLSAITSNERFYSELAVVQLLFGVVIYFTVTYQFRHKEQVRALLSTVLAVAVLAVIAALVMDRKHQLHDLAGSFQDRQLFGAFLMLILPVILGVAAGTRNRAWKAAAQLSCILVAGALLMTTCRSAWFGLVAALAMFATLGAVFVWKVKALSRYKHELLVTPALALVVIGVFVMFTKTGGAITGRASTLSSIQSDDSVKDRLNLWNVGEKMIAAHPFAGSGIGTYALAQRPFNPESRDEILIRQLGPSLSESPHNTYVQLAAEQGLLGLAFYLAIIALFFYRGVTALPRMDKGLRQYTLIGCLAAIAGQCVDGFANPAWMYPEVSTFFWLVLGIGMCAAGVGNDIREEKSREDESRQPVLGMPSFLFRGVRTALVLCTAVWMGVQLLNLNSVSAAYAGADSHARQGENPPAGYRPIYADFITKLAVNFLNANLVPPACFNLHSGAIYSDRTAEFHVYALTADPRFYANVTSEWTEHLIKIKLHGLKGKFYYTNSSNQNRLYFIPAKSKKLQGKTGTITFTYHITKPNSGDYSANFDLTVLPSGQPINESAGRNPMASQGMPSFDVLKLPGLVPVDVEEDKLPDAEY